MEGVQQPNQHVESQVRRTAIGPRFCHIAARVEDCIVVTGGKINLAPWDILPLNEIWIYNLHTEQWSRYTTPADKEAPNPRCKASGVTIGRNIYLFGGLFRYNGHFNDMWILTNPLSRSDAFWEKIVIADQNKQPSPRSDHRAWEYGGKMWVFGGIGSQLDGYLSDHGTYAAHYSPNVVNNQLLVFDPSTKEWSNPRCSGHVPTPRKRFGSAVIDDKFFLFGGYSSVGSTCDNLFMLKMESTRQDRYNWTRILTGYPRPPSYASSLTAVNDKLVLHSTDSDAENFFQVTWVFDPSTCSWVLHSRCTEETRDYFVACKGINNEVIIFGGQSYYGSKSIRHQVQTILPQPKSLRQLAMKEVYMHRDILDWKILPDTVRYDLRILGETE